MDSDSDIEVLEEMGKGSSSSMKSDVGFGMGDVDELLDLDGGEEIPFSAWKNDGIGSRPKHEGTNAKRKVANGFNSQPATDLGDDDDDLNSLLSLSPPPAPKKINLGSSKQKSTGSVYDNHQTHLQKKKRSTFEDENLQEIDDFLQDAEFSSLDDYLTEMKLRQTDKTSRRKSKSPNSSFEEQVTSYEEKEKAKRSKPSATSKVAVGNSKKVSPIKKVTQALSATSKSSSAVAAGGAEASAMPKPKPGDAKKMIVLHIPEEILTNSLASLLMDKEINVQVEDSPLIKDAILFEHNVPYKLVGRDLQIQEKMVKEMDEHVVIIFPVDKYLHLFQNEVDGFDDTPDSQTSSTETLTEWAGKLMRRNKGKKFTLFIQGMEAYSRKVARATQKEYKDRLQMSEKPENGKKKRKANQNNILLNRTSIQSALIMLQLNTDINYKFYEKENELSVFLAQYAKSVLDALQQKGQESSKSTDFDWYAVADSVGGILVEDTGKGLRSLWIDQLCQFPKVGQERALAIVRKYGTPRELYEAYRKCTSIDEGKNLLANIQITVGVGPLAKKQNLGPEASRRIYRFFTATKGDRQIH